MTLNFFLWSVLTIAIYFAWRRLFLATKQPWLHPVLGSVLTIVALLELTRHPYPAYKEETTWIVWFLQPAVVALAVPIFHRRRLILENFKPLSALIVFGVVFSVLSVYGLLLLFHLDLPLIQALTLKSITAPIARDIALGAHLDDALAGFGVMVAGIMGAIAAPTVLKWGRVRDPRAVGLAMGATSHGVGTARAVELGEVAGAFASIGLSCTAIVSSLLCPLLLLYVIK
jgi:putative effector of murein hydrolase